MDFTQSLTLITAGLYYIITGIFVLFGLFTVYITIKYGANRLFSLVLSTIFIVFFLTTLTLSFSTLLKLQQAVTTTF
ncbi:MAG: hypothetical protein IT410_02425 [Candidatus Doudnabacteria bacterium]|nr:hypothetical protein [Candidatus Doudnabacteria bacterium]